MSIFEKPEIEKEKLKICEQCEYYTKVISRCKNCGCIIFAKAKLPGSRCVIGKWDILFNDNNASANK